MRTLAITLLSCLVLLAGCHSKELKETQIALDKCQADNAMLKAKTQKSMEQNKTVMKELGELLNAENLRAKQLEKTVEGLQSTIKELKANHKEENTKLRNSMMSALKKSSALSVQIKKLQAQLAQTTQEKAAAEQQCQDKNTTLAQTIQKLAMAESQIKTLKETIEKLQVQLAEDNDDAHDGDTDQDGDEEKEGHDND